MDNCFKECLAISTLAWAIEIDYILHFDKEANWSIGSRRKRAAWKRIFQKLEKDFRKESSTFLEAHWSSKEIVALLIWLKSFTNTAVCALLVILYQEKFGKIYGKLVDIGHNTLHSSWRNYKTLSKVLNPLWSVICHFAVMKFHSQWFRQKRGRKYPKYLKYLRNIEMSGQKYLKS